MKRRLFVFFALALTSLLLVPSINILQTPAGETVRWRDRDFLYNVDFLIPHVARLLTPFGISIAPTQVIIGRQEWLHLGDQYERTLSEDRRPYNQADRERGRSIAAATAAWGSYFESQGVRLFRIMVGPNKGSIYPESLPDWARPAKPNPTDALFAETGEHHIDLRPALKAARTAHPEALYYRTDTHWNFIGAGLAFQAFAGQIAAAAPEIRWPSNDEHLTSRSLPRPGGDLARFLRLTESLTDLEPIPQGLEKPLDTVQQDFDSQEILYQGRNGAIVAQTKPLLVKSPQALNRKKVLWLRDSFGTALSPIMATTFSEVVQLHWSEALKPDGRLTQLVETWKPDYVFVTVVERDARAEAFTRFPPPALTPMPGSFTVKRTSRLVDTNAVERLAAPAGYRIKGPDPYLDFALSAPVLPTEFSHLSIELDCLDHPTAVPMQFFWLEAGRPYFDGERSVKFSLKPGKNLLDLRTLKAWQAAPSIVRLRLDIDAPDVCVNFRLSPPSLG